MKVCALTKSYIRKMGVTVISNPFSKILRPLMSSGTILVGLSLSGLSNADSFEEALIATYNNHPQILAERTRLREIDETYVQARAQGRLSADINADTGFLETQTVQPSIFGDNNTVSSELKPHSAQIQFIQPVYQGGRVSALKAQAKASILSARETLRSIEQDLFITTATAYADVIRDEASADIRRKNIRVLDSQKFAAQERFRLGDGTKTDIEQSRSRIAAAEIGLAQADAQLASSRALYIEAVGYPPNELTPVPTFILPETLAEAQQIARSNNPQLIASKFDEEAGEAEIKIARSAYRPTLTLNGSYSLAEAQSINLSESESTSIVAQLRIPIFTGGLTNSQVRSAKHARTRLSFETRTLERALDRQVAQLWGQIDAARRTVTASQTQVESAKAALTGVELEQKVGARTALDVLDAEEEFLIAQISQLQAKRDLDVASFQFLGLLGAFDAIGLQLSTEYYDSEENFRSVSFIGQDEFIDRYVPEAAQKIGRQLPNIPHDIVNAISASTISNNLAAAADKTVKTVDDLGNDAKEGLDFITRQKPVYGPPPLTRNSKETD